MLPKRSLRTANYLSRAMMEQGIMQNLKDIFQKESYKQMQSSVVLDLGSGSRYYEQLFVSKTYLSLDITIDDKPDVVGVGEALPIANSSIDIILCIQVLEHVNNPDQVIREISRVLRPGGIILLTTHGTMFYHPTPQDYWRWTQAGLRKLFQDNGDFRQIDIEPAQGTFSTLGFLCAWYINMFLSKVAHRLGPLKGITLFLISLLVGLVNIVALMFDRFIPSMSNVDRSNTLFGIFIVRAER